MRTSDGTGIPSNWTGLRKARAKKRAVFFAVCAAAAILFTASSALLSYLIIPPDYTRTKIHTLETTPFDCIIFGTSHGATAFDPETFEAGSGKTFYNAAAGGLYPGSVYFMLQDALRSYTPETVILEYDPSYYMEEDGGNPNERYAVYCMAPSAVKTRFFFASAWKRDLRYAMMPWYMQRSQIANIPQNLARKRSEEYRTYDMGLFGDENTVIMDDGFVSVEGDWVEEGEVPVYGAFEGDNVANNEAYFRKTLALCREKGIRAVVVLTPVPEETREANLAFYKDASAAMQAIASEYGADYLDFVTDISCDLPVDAFYDLEGHMHTHAARAFSSAVCQMGRF